jgi:NAD(P)-dependent dehydrogenase (short-subunit alcohol dehydrogenase family)
MRRLEGRIAVITGGAGGIGRAIARRLTDEGATCVLADLDGPRADEAAAAIGGLGVQTDITSSASVNALRDAVLARYGRADIVVNNAGIHLQKLVVDMTDDEWDAIQDTNARGCFFVCRAFAPAMMRQESGRIINIITKLGAGNPYSSAYIASKSAIFGFTQCLANELSPYGVTVNAVAPGHIGPGTGLEKWFRRKAELLGQSWEEFERTVLRSIPMGRWCRPEDVAAAVAYVASDEAGFMTAEAINVTGGWSGYGSPPPRQALTEVPQ